MAMPRAAPRATPPRANHPAVPQTLTIDLAAGRYVLICNIVEKDDEIESHYQEGMRVSFTVE